MTNKKAIGWLKLAKESSHMAMSQEEWSTGPKYIGFSNAEIGHYTPEELFDEVVELKNRVTVYRTSCEIVGNRGQATYTIEAPVKAAPKKNKKAAKKVAKKDILPLEEIVEILQED